jgi:hypothetical protein
VRDELRVYTISDRHWTGISCSCCNGERAKLKDKKMDAETLADINKLDAVANALKTENESLREKIADVHSLMCEASAMLAGITAGGRVDIDGAFKNIQLAIRRAA